MAPSENNEKKNKQDLFGSHLTLFRNQKLEVAGEIYFKASRFHKSRKHFVELRESTLLVFRTEKVSQMAVLDTKHIVAVITMERYNATVIQKDDGFPRIYITTIPARDDKLMYIRVTKGLSELEAWCYGLAKAKAVVLPTLGDLIVESVIGRGGGGRVFMVHWKRDGRTYALKGISKDHAFRSEKSFRHVASERQLMEYVKPHPFLLQMQFAFQTETNLFIGTPFCGGGDLASYLRAKGDRSMPQEPRELAPLCLHDQRRRRIYGRLSEDQTRLLAAEIILGLEHLHQHGIIYRDLKPENIFIDKTGHIKIGDYGLAKSLGDREGSQRLRANSVCGTRNYLPPEMLMGKLYSFEADLWTLGVVIYRILCGAFPFEAPRSNDLFYKVKSNEPLLPKWLSRSSCQLLRGLLQKNPNRRLTMDRLKCEPFFAEIDWQDVYGLRAGPSVPNVDVGSSVTDALDNFELSKLHNITLGEYIGEDEEDDEKPESEHLMLPTHQQNIARIMIGFEFAHLEEGMPEPIPLGVTRKSGGILSKLSSLDELALKSPRALSGLISQKSYGFRSPRAGKDTDSTIDFDQRIDQGSSQAMSEHGEPEEAEAVGIRLRAIRLRGRDP